MCDAVRLVPASCSLRSLLIFVTENANDPEIEQNAVVQMENLEDLIRGFLEYRLR